MWWVRLTTYMHNTVAYCILFNVSFVTISVQMQTKELFHIFCA